MIVGAIFARGGSKGVPRKNVRPLAGKPLIAWAVEAAHACPSLERVVVSTDDEEIAEAARAAGAEVPFLRPAHLAADDSPELLSWRHMIEHLQAEGPLEALVSVPATAPFRDPQDVERCLAALLESDADLALCVTEAPCNPYFSMVRIEDGYAQLAASPPEMVTRRQDAPPVYAITPVAYAVRPAYVLAHESLLVGKVKAVEVPRARALDIDTEDDWLFAEFLATRRSSQT